MPVPSGYVMSHDNNTRKSSFEHNFDRLHFTSA